MDQTVRSGGSDKHLLLCVSVAAVPLDSLFFNLPIMARVARALFPSACDADAAAFPLPSLFTHPDSQPTSNPFLLRLINSSVFPCRRPNRPPPEPEAAAIVLPAPQLHPSSYKPHPEHRQPPFSPPEMSSSTPKHCTAPISSNFPSAGSFSGELHRRNSSPPTCLRRP